MSEKIVGWGLIGASTIAKEWMAGAIRSHSRCRLQAIYSSSKSRAAAFASEQNIPAAYDDLEEMLGNPDVDAVYVSTTNEQHLAQTLAAARAGKHILCEKPLALQVEEAEQMVKAAREAGVVLGTNHHLRNMGSHRAIKRLMEEHAIGKVVAARIFHAVELPQSLKTWRLYNKAAGAGVIFDIGVHDADLLRFYFGHNPLKIAAIATTSADGPKEVEDSVMSVWEFPGNVLVQCHDSFVTGAAPRGVEIHGTEGSILGLDIMSQAPSGKVVLRGKSGDRDIPFDKEIPYHRTIADFVSAIDGKGDPSATGEDGVWSLRLGTTVAEAAARGRTIDVE